MIVEEHFRICTIDIATTNNCIVVVTDTEIDIPERRGDINYTNCEMALSSASVDNNGNGMIDSAVEYKTS
jgi:hypothetical protein